MREGAPRLTRPDRCGDEDLVRAVLKNAVPEDASERWTPGERGCSGPADWRPKSAPTSTYSAIPGGEGVPCRLARAPGLGNPGRPHLCARRWPTGTVDPIGHRLRPEASALAQGFAMVAAAPGCEAVLDPAQVWDESGAHLRPDHLPDALNWHCDVVFIDVSIKSMAPDGSAPELGERECSHRRHLASPGTHPGNLRARGAEGQAVI
jgi:hypothetical protein